MEGLLQEVCFLASHGWIRGQGVIFKIFNKRAWPIRASSPEPAPGGPLLGCGTAGRCGGDPGEGRGLWLFTHQCGLVPIHTRGSELPAGGGGWAGSERGRGGG